MLDTLGGLYGTVRTRAKQAPITGVFEHYKKEFLESIKRGSFLTSTREVITHVRVMGTGAAYANAG